MEYVKGPVCGIDNCPSKRYYEPGDGFWYCKNNHKQPGNIADKDDEAFPGASTRTTRKQRQAIEQRSILLEGREAIELYLKCLQQVLWKQVHWLVNVKRYPAKLEEVVRDLWTLRLTLVPALSDAVFQVDDNTQRLFSSQSSGGDTSDDERLESRMYARMSRSRQSEKLPRLIDTLAICYLGLLLIQFPVRLGDFHAWAHEEDFVFLTALASIPRQLSERLPIGLKTQLGTQTGLSELEKLPAMTLNLAAGFKNKHGMQIHPLNHNLLLFRYATDLGLPQIIPAANELKSILNYSFTMDAADKHYVKISDHPEIKLVALLVVTVKILFPFDKIQRHVTTATEPAALTVDWDAWNEIYAKDKMGSEEEPRDQQSALKTTESDVFDMTEAELDKYLSWFQRTWIERRATGNGSSQAQQSQRSSMAGDATGELNEEETLQGPQADFYRGLFSLFPLQRPPVDERGEESSSGRGTNPPARGDDGLPDEQIFAPARLQRIEKVQNSLIALPLAPEAPPKDLAGSNARANQKRRPRTSKRPSKPSSKRPRGEPSGSESSESSDAVEVKVIRPGEAYKQYRKAADVPALARPFFERVAAMAGLDLDALVLALRQTEARCQRWVRGERSRRRQRNQQDLAEEDVMQE